MTAAGTLQVDSLSQLSRGGRRRVFTAVKKVASSGATVVAAVHHLTDAEKIADRVSILDGGRRLAFSGSNAARA